MKYTVEQLKNISEKIKKMPAVDIKKQKYSKQEAIKMLSKEITLMKKRGYTIDQISEALRGEGLNIATPTLKSYLQRSKLAKKSQIKPQIKIQADTPPPAHGVKKLADKSEAAFMTKPDTDDI